MIKQSVFIAFTFAVNYWGVSTSAPHVSGPAQVVFSQVPTVFATILTAIIFSRRYGILAIVGVFLTIAGTVVQSVGGGISGSTTVGWVIVFIAGNLPGAIWAVAFEGFHKAKGKDGETNTMELRMLWTNVFLVLWLLLFIPFFGLLDQPPLPDFWENFGNATHCVFYGEGGNPEDDCKNAGWLIAVTIPIASLQAHAQIVVSRDDSGLLATLALALAPFLCDLVFPFPAIMGKYYDPVSMWDILAAGLCLLGVILFSYSERGRKLQEGVDTSKLIKWFTDTKLPACLSRFNSRESKNLLGESSIQEH